MKNFVEIALETHLFFARIMKEHAIFLQAGFPCKNKEWIKRAEYYQEEFGEILKQVLEISDGRVDRKVLKSRELVTEFTIPAEKATQHLTGIPINCGLTALERKLRPGCGMEEDEKTVRLVERINKKAIWLLCGFIDFKENILEEVRAGNLFTANYPLLLEHIIREAKLYCSILEDLKADGEISCDCIREKEEFWNCIMMEHALFIRGLLDPCEEKLIGTADDFAMQYKKLLEMAKKQDCRATGELTEKSLEETLKYRKFKAAGTEGILECKIASIILPLLADHVLREANHYIRILESRDMK